MHIEIIARIGEVPQNRTPFPTRPCLKRVNCSHRPAALAGILAPDRSSLWQCWPSAARALARQDEKRCSSERARPDGVRRLEGKRGSTHLPEAKYPGKPQGRPVGTNHCKF